MSESVTVNGYATASRVFEGTRKGQPFTVTTSLTDAQAIEVLRVGGSEGFAADCAAQIELMGLAKERNLPIKVRMNLVAWGFRMAEEKLNRVTLTLHPSYLSRVAFRRPLTFAVGDEVVSISICGSTSKHAGKYRVSNGQPFGSPDQKFYGFADPNGTWAATKVTPSTVVEALTRGK